MNDHLDDPLRSDAQVGYDHGEVTSPTSAVSQVSPTAPFLSPTSRDYRRDIEQQSPLQAQATTLSQHVGPKSAYYVGPPGKDSAFGTPPVGVIGRDKPREIIRIERDYSGGELCQFHPTFPLELEGRLSPTIFAETINDINVLIIKANDAGWACLDNTIAVLSLYTSPFLLGSRYRREMKKLDDLICRVNKTTLNPAGLNLRNPADTAFLFMELEYF